MAALQVGAIAVLASLSLGFDPPPPTGGVEIDWHSIDGGGNAGAPLTGSDGAIVYEIVGTIGQPDAGGPMTGLDGPIVYEIVGGFVTTGGGEGRWAGDNFASFFDEANWADGGIPEPTDTVVLTGDPSPYTITFFGCDATTGRLLILDDDVEFLFDSQNYHLTGGDATAGEPSFVLGGPGQTAHLRIRPTAATAAPHGVLANSAWLGAGAGSVTTLRLTDPFAYMETYEELVIGASGDATVLIGSGAELRSNLVTIVGRDAGSIGDISIDGANATWRILGSTDFTIGRGGEGLITITNGGRLFTTTDVGGQGQITLADLPGSHAEVRVIGAGSQWVESNPDAAVFVGDEDRALLLAEGGGLIAIPEIQIADDGIVGGSGTLDATTVENRGTLVIGEPGNTGFGPSGPSALTITGNYTQFGEGSSAASPAGNLVIHYGDNDGAVESDTLSINGTNVFLDGGLIVESLDGSDLDLGATLDFLFTNQAVSSEFDVAFMPGLAGGKFLNTAYNAAEGGGGVSIVVQSLIPPDGFGAPNSDGVVAAGDPIDVAVEDLDCDGDDDLAVLLAGDGVTEGTLVVLLSAGVDGGGVWQGFEDTTIQTVGDDPSAIAIGHFNEDDLPDIAVANRGADQNVVLFRNNDLMAGTFAQFGAPIPIDEDPVDITVGDFDNNGLDDIAALHPDGTLINGEVTLFGRDVDPFEFSELPVTIQFAGLGDIIEDRDLDDDKKDDIAVGQAQSGQVLVRFQNDGMFLAADEETITVGESPSAIDFIADPDGSDSTHIVVANAGDDTVSVIVNASKETFAPAVNLPVGDRPLDITTLDIDEDGDTDIAVLVDNGTDPASVQILRQDDSSVGILFADAEEFDLGVNPILMDHGDLDADGVDDLFTLEGAGPLPGGIGTVHSRLNLDDCPGDVDGSGAADVSDLLQLIGAWGPCPGCPEDLDGDGVVDVSDMLILLGAWGDCE